MSKRLIASAAVLMATNAIAACPTITADKANGAYPNLFEKAEFERLHQCNLSFAENPAIQALNKRIAGNPAIPAVAERLPQEPLVIAPYQQIGQYGGVLDGISKATESGTSDLLAVRHVNLTRFSDDLATVVPNVAKSWQWNDDFTVLTMSLRKGHKWSDGNDFTAEDVVFWYHNMLMDTSIIKSPKERFLSDGKPMQVEAVDETTVRFTLNAPMPSLPAMFAQDYAQPFQPKHLLEQFHPALNKDADKRAQELGFENGYAVINFYYGQSDWKDVPTPLLKDKAAAERLVKAGYTAVAPTLESHIVVEDTLEGRRLVANPYFFQVDTAGNQLPYINEINEVFIGDEDIQVAKMIAGEIDYKTQAVNLPSAPVLLENKAQGNYSVTLRPNISLSTYAFNMTDKDLEKRAVFNDINFRRAMSVAIDRNKINEVAYFNLGKPAQYTAFDSATAPFVSEKMLNQWIQFDQTLAKQLLDKAGVVDKDGDGKRDLPSGKKFELPILFSTQETATEVVEIIANNWNQVGIETSIKEVTSDEYRNSQSANDLTVMFWKMGRPLATLASNTTDLLPPYGSFFDIRTGMLWEQFRNTNGAEGVKPPATVDKMSELAAKFVTLKMGSDASNKVGAEIAQRVADDMFVVGTVKAVAPIYRSNKLGNFQVQKTHSYDYYWSYPYMPTQWFLAE
ncbi:ABC transporter substrate-binding protein [Neptunomonas marina]|uniref:ABC transporter substrate-binding protein n=1 Tax=Neptunomonas marina TaxID=1815562 RepID=A0A437Q8A7_9GAMM|nr:ABC transporter substrate-binding protein [Neptunomonas marina]RVU30716.1 ABC transporter substrate-binding protein [Neptunomonas marina]